MQIEPTITYRNVEPSSSLDAKVRERIAHLDRLFPNLTSCRVAIARDDSHQHQGRHYRVRVDLTAPGHELVADRAPAQHQAHEDPFVALRDAFDAIERRVQDLARELRGDVKTHVAPAHGRVVELDAAAGHHHVGDPLHDLPGSPAAGAD